MRFLCTFHYGFYCDVKLRNLYSFLMFVACCSKRHCGSKHLPHLCVNFDPPLFHTVGVYVIVLSDRLQAYEFRKLRTGVFIGIGSLALVPFSHGVLRYGASTFPVALVGRSKTDARPLFSI